MEFIDNPEYVQNRSASAEIEYRYDILASSRVLLADHGVYMCGVVLKGLREEGHWEYGRIR